MQGHEEIGSVIRRLRKQAGLTGTQLGEKAGFSQSKISNIEAGTQRNLTAEELENILNILHTPKTIKQHLLALTHTPLADIMTGRKFVVSWNAPTTFERERRTTSLKVFIANVFPALLQSLDYREALLKAYDLSDQQRRYLLKQTVNRQDLLWDKHRRFHFIFQETALYSMPADRTVQVKQLDRIERLLDRPNIKVGIVPTEAGLTLLEHSGMAIYNEKELITTTLGVDIGSTDTNEIAQYLGIFTELDKKAHYAQDAAALLHKAIDYFS